MNKMISIVCIVLALASCSAAKQNVREVSSQERLQIDTLERARGLTEVGENSSALKLLDRIINARPITKYSIEAVLMSADILLLQKKAQNAIENLRMFEKRARAEKLDVRRIGRAIERAKIALAVESKPQIEPKPVDSLVIAPPSSETLPSRRNISNSVGVILPLSGPFKVYGERMLAAMRLALGEAETRNEDGALIFRNQDGFSIAVLDSKGDVETSKLAVDRLVDKYNIGVVVGDILADTAMAIAGQAKARDVVNITLSRKDGVTLVAEKIYQLAVTARKQTEALLSIRAENAIPVRYAIMHPENSFGREMRDAFVFQAKKIGANIVKIESYNANETTFTNHIRRLVGPKRTAGNVSYEQCLLRSVKITDVNARKKAERDCLEAVPPSVGFDALFLPDFPKAIGYIVPALIAEGVMVSQNEGMVNSYRRTSHLKDAKPVQLLGPNTWNQPVMGEKLGIQLDGALFIESGEFQESREEVAQFMIAFNKLMSSSPVVAEALAFDAVQMCSKAFAAARNGSEVDLNRFVQAIQSRVQHGLVGKILFNEARESVIPFHWFSFEEGKILLYDHSRELNGIENSNDH